MSRTKRDRCRRAACLKQWTVCDWNSKSQDFVEMLCRNLALLLTLFTLPPDTSQRKSQGPKPGQSAEARLDHLLETGRGSNAKAPLQTPTELRIISYNIRWRGGDELRKLIKLFRDDVQIGGAAILGLQEVDRSKKRT